VATIRTINHLADEQGGLEGLAAALLALRETPDTSSARDPG
jgi:hypothetical protein